jgi:hypothetical protein
MQLLHSASEGQFKYLHPMTAATQYGSEQLKTGFQKVNNLFMSLQSFAPTTKIISMI